VSRCLTSLSTCIIRHFGKSFHAINCTYYKNKNNPKISRHTNHHNRFTALFRGPPEWASTRRELLDFMLQGKINSGRHTDHPAGRHCIQTNQCPPLPSPIFCRSDALPVAQPTMSKHWRQKIQTARTWYRQLTRNRKCKRTIWNVT